MKRILLEVLTDPALDELRLMEGDGKIRILNEDDLRLLSGKRDEIWKELEQYTYESIVKNVKQSAK